MRYSIILLVFFYINLQATIFVNTQATIELLPNSKIYHDIGNHETINIILKNDDKFITTNKKAIDYCSLVPEGVWIKFELQNPTNKTIQKILKIDNFSTERIDLYKVSNNKVLSKKTTGIYYLEKFHGFVTLNIPFDIKANTIETYYLNVKNEKLSLWFKPELYAPKVFYKDDTFHQIIWALFFGGIFSLIFYNIFLFIFTKDKIYLYYFLYLIATLLQSQFSIYPTLYLLPMDDMEFVKKSLYVNIFYVNVFVTFTMTLFIRKFLDTVLYPKIDFTLKLLLYIIPIYFILQIFNIFTIPQVVIFQFFTPYYFLWIGFYALYKKNPQAKFFLLGWSFALVAWLSLFFQYMGIFPVKYIFEYTFETLIMAEVILFAISLAYRIKTLEKKKNDLTQTLLVQQQNESNRLEKIVNIRTQELNNELKQNELLLKELHHRVKNNMQFITSLYALKLNDNNDKHIQEKLYDVERKIHAMSIVHQMLYNQKNLVNIDAKEYFEKVLQNIKDSFELENITFELDINSFLDTEEAIYCGLIVNELVTNAIKHAFDSSGGIIKISLNNVDNGTLLEVSDNGIGKSANTNASFGEMMVESLATDQLEGKLQVVVDKGTHISLWFKNKNQKSNGEYNDS
ncbi:MAG: 7TM diverse intracellular signaling domain-containing protein [Arcobacteraceae bacterium]|jgi:two-component sensor histidine kinase